MLSSRHRLRAEGLYWAIWNITGTVDTATASPDPEDGNWLGVATERDHRTTHPKAIIAKNLAH